MTDLKTILKEMIFGVDYGKCKLAYELYLNQLGLQLMKITPILGDYNLTKEDVTDMFAKHNIFGYLPFIHFSVLCQQGVISKRELVAILYHMCDSSNQPPSLVRQIFSFMDSSLTTDMISEAHELELEEYQQFFEEYGILPILISEYHDVCENGSNIYASVIDLITVIEGQAVPNE